MERINSNPQKILRNRFTTLKYIVPLVATLLFSSCKDWRECNSHCKELSNKETVKYPIDSTKVITNSELESSIIYVGEIPIISMDEVEKVKTTIYFNKWEHFTENRKIPKNKKNVIKKPIYHPKKNEEGNYTPSFYRYHYIIE